MRVLRVFERPDAQVYHGSEKHTMTLHETLEAATGGIEPERLGSYQFYNLGPIALNVVRWAASRRLRALHERATSIIDGKLAMLERRPVVLDAEARIPRVGCATRFTGEGTCRPQALHPPPRPGRSLTRWLHAPCSWRR